MSAANTTVITKPALAVAAVISVVSFISPALAQSSSNDRYQMSASQKMHRNVNRIPRFDRGQDAFAASNVLVDPNSPEATGGGSIGYNRKLYED